MRGYKKVHNVWFSYWGEWKAIGTGRLPLAISELDNAREIAFEAFTRPGVQAVMVVQVETALHSNLETMREESLTSYTALV